MVNVLTPDLNSETQRIVQNAIGPKIGRIMIIWLILFLVTRLNSKRDTQPFLCSRTSMRLFVTWYFQMFISTDQCIAFAFYVTDVGRMRTTRCILLRRKARDFSVNHSRPLVKINAHPGNEYQTQTNPQCACVSSKNFVSEKILPQGKKKVYMRQIYTLLMRMQK